MSYEEEYTVEYDEKRSSVAESLGEYYQVTRDWDEHLVGFIIKQNVIEKEEENKEDEVVVGELWLCENDLTEGPFREADDAIMALIRINKRRGG